MGGEELEGGVWGGGYGQFCGEVEGVGGEGGGLGFEVVYVEGVDGGVEALGQEDQDDVECGSDFDFEIDDSDVLVPEKVGRFFCVGLLEVDHVEVMVELVVHEGAWQYFNKFALDALDRQVHHQVVVYLNLSCIKVIFG